MSVPARTVRRYLARLRGRATFVFGGRAVSAAAGGALLTFAIAAFLAGPVTSMAAAALAWLSVLSVAALGAAWALRSTRALGGGGAARFLQDVDAELASAARSAVELDQDTDARAQSPGLVLAHAERVRAALVLVPAARVVPFRWLVHRTVFAGALAAAVAAMLLLGVDRAASGAWALAHPGERDDTGLRVAAVVGDVQLRLVYPGYLERASVELSNPANIEAPRGTSVELLATPRIDATAGVLEVGEHEVRLAEEEDGRLRGRFVVRDDGPLRIRLTSEDGTWFLDPTRRMVRVLADEAPRIALIEPHVDHTIELREEVPVLWEATDDVGLRAVDLVVRMPDGRERRESLVRFDDLPEPEARGRSSVMAASLEAQPGDQLSLWLVARDGDEVAGPNEGRSATRILTVASDSTRRAERIADLSDLLAAGLDALADRLENAVPRDGEGATRRHELLSESGRRFTDALDGVATRLRGQADTGDAGVLAEMARRLRQSMAREARLHGDRPAARGRRTAVDTDMVEELERDVLLLADLVGRERLEDAAAIARELDAIRRQMTSLLAELRRADSPEARQALLAAIARAQARMQELAARLAAMSEDVPSDYVNADAMPRAEAEDALAAMREAIESGDLDTAERQLAELQRQIDQLASLLGGGMESFAEARFGPRERAMAEAMDALAGLEAEQHQLARRTDDVRRGAAERALSATGARNDEAARRLSRRAVQARRSLEAALGGRGTPVDRETFERARQRLDDVADALQTGDLGEARRMAEEATADVEDVSRDLDLSALMFPGAEGSTADAARAAQEAADELRDLRRDIDRAIPRVEDFVGEAGRRQMRGDGGRQGRAAEAAGRLAERFAEGPDGAPLSPDAATAVGQAQDAMQRGRQSLERGDPIEGSRTQEEAARRLTELREELEQNQQSQAGGGDGGNGEGAAGRPDFREAVRIPGAEEFEGPVAQRRRLLDAMREEAPPGFGDAVRRYYEELLR